MKPPTPIQLPRPNPGPEPWSTEPQDPAWWPILAASLGLFFLAGFVLLIRRARRARSAPSPSLAAPSAVKSADDPLRTALIRMFGEGWRALTTEEIARSPEFAARFEPEVVDRVVSYLRQSDEARFSGGRIEVAPEARAWADHFLEFVGEVGPMSRIKGR